MATKVKSRLGILPPSVVSFCHKHEILKSLFLRSCGSVPPANGHATSRENGLDEIILQHCADGKGWAELGAERHLLRSGDTLIIPRNTPHAYGPDEATGWTNYWIHFRGEHADAFVELLGIKVEQPILSAPKDLKLEEHFDLILDTYESGHTLKHLLTAAHTLEAVLLRLLQIKTPTTTLTKNHSAIEKTIRYMEVHLQERPTLQELAQIACLSRAHFHTLFKASTGHAPIEYFNQLKIKKACQQLTLTDQRIEEISNSLGFKNAFYFSRLFKKIMNVAPSDYRKAPF